MLRNVGAVVVGLIVGMAVNMLIVLLNSRLLFPLPEGMGLMTSSPEQIAAYIATLPPTAFLVAMVAHLGQAFVGGWVAARLGASHPVGLALIVGALSMMAGIMNAMSIKPPLWTMVELPLYLVVAWLAGRMVRDRRAAA